MSKDKTSTAAAGTALVQRFSSMVESFGGEVGEALRQNVAGEDIGPGDLPRIKIPAGGSLAWEIETEGAPSIVPSFVGILIERQRRRAYWPIRRDESGNVIPPTTGVPPVCMAPDGMHGIGSPGGTCSECEFSKYGTKGRGQACKDMRALFFLLPDTSLPHVLMVPPTSIKPVKNFLLKLKRPMYAYLTEFSLVADKNQDGTKYSRLNLATVGELPEEAIPGVRAFVDGMRSIFAAVAPVAESSDDDE